MTDPTPQAMKILRKMVREIEAITNSKFGDKTWAMMCQHIAEIESIWERQFDAAEGVGKEMPAITWDSLSLEQQQMLLGCQLATVTVSRRQEGWQTAWDLEGLKLVEMLSGSARHNAGGGAVEVQLTDAGREIVQGKDMTDWFGDKNRKT